MKKKREKSLKQGAMMMQFLKLKTMNHLILILMTARRKGRKENPNKKITLKISKRRRHKREERMMTVTMMILKMIQEKNQVRKRKVDQTLRNWIQKRKKMIYWKILKLSTQDLS